MKKVFLASFSIVLCLVLSGCYGLIADVTINNDGSGTMSARMGLSETSYNMIKSFGDDSTSQVATEQDIEPFEYNGKTYYGSTQSISFSNVEEFNAKSSENIDEQVNTGSMVLSKNQNGSLTLTLTVTPETGSPTEEAEMTMGSSQIPEEQLLEDMVVIYTFNMPGNVTQIEGDSNGITVNDNVIQIDFLKLNLPKENENEKIYMFTTQQQVEVKEAITFADVPSTLWSYEAINALATGGLVSGVGENKFSPNRGMKIAEFCQILANAIGLETGVDENGYWAGKAIASCIEKGYIYAHGEINVDNYSRVITREEAISAMQIASGRSPLGDKRVNLEDIPDNEQIDDRYKDLILQAYNSGITSGVNEQFKFSPKSQLTRGQVCQLFYNVDWTTSINN